MSKNTNTEQSSVVSDLSSPEPVELVGEPVPALFTGWASNERLDAPDSFDEDQHAVNNWAQADSEQRIYAIENEMRLADAEELIATAKGVAIEHMKRADQARQLVKIVAARLGREAEALHAVDPETVGKAVPTQTKAMPVPARNLPSAL